MLFKVDVPKKTGLQKVKRVMSLTFVLMSFLFA